MADYLNIDIKGMVKAAKFLDAKYYDQIATSYLNKLNKQTLNAGKKKIKEIYNIKSKDLNKSFKIIPATKGRDFATIRIRGFKIPFIIFGARQSNRKAPVKTTIFKGQPGESTTSFIAMPRGFNYRNRGQIRPILLNRQQVYQSRKPLQKGKSYPLDVRKGPSVPQMFKNPSVQNTVKTYIKNNAARIFKGQFDWVLGKIGKKYKG